MGYDTKTFLKILISEIIFEKDSLGNTSTNIIVSLVVAN